LGQYYYCVNLTKGEYMRPHAYNQGAKLSEFSSDSHGIMQALALLLSDGNGRGGGDFNAPDPDPEGIIGRWAGDNIALPGDYGDNDKFLPEGYVNGEGEPSNLYEYARDNFEDISDKVIARIKKAADDAEKAKETPAE